MLTQVPRSRWGGIADGRFQPSGFFRVGHSHRTFWLVDPDGGRFLSKGVNTVQFKQDKIRNSERIPYADACRKKYGSEAAWRTAAAKRLAGWGFNTLGSWSDEAVAAAGSMLAVAPNLDLGMSFAWQHNDRNPSAPPQHFPDVFDPAFERHVHQRARALCAKHSGERRILGWFIDNELRWGPDWRGPEQLLPLFLNLSEVSPGRVAALGWLRERGANGPTPSAADYEAFAGLVADRYFALTTVAIKAVDPNHLVLGCRFAVPPPMAVIATAGRHLDVISFNCYDLDPSATIDGYAATGKPCLIGEFSFRGRRFRPAQHQWRRTAGGDPGRARGLLPALRHRGAAQANARRLSLVRARRSAGGGPLRRREFQFRHGHDRRRCLRGPHAHHDRGQCRGGRSAFRRGGRHHMTCEQAGNANDQ